jgi:hypothetical protein
LRFRQRGEFNVHMRWEKLHSFFLISLLRKSSQYRKIFLTKIHHFQSPSRLKTVQLLEVRSRL